ncbi:hypothetical protein GCM10007932_37120 [Vibrio penaeicida]|uniref:Uncharacterized protein n=2 Tax=Vibrio penaeicida TaxID=104609 RepID=A0AAV5NUM8_9VIBR|nr:hypothetical protein GCM10007932_37120 [Vibrio penaeicida]
MSMWGNDLLSWLYDNLEEAYDAGEDYVIQKANQVADAAVASVQWIWEALQGDFNENMTTGQIAANAVLGVIPIVDQVLDCRDIIANCKKINEKPNDTWAWVALCLTIIGLIPSLGSVVKGVLKIIFLFLRKAGGDVFVLVGRAMRPVFAFLADPKVQKLLGDRNIYDILQEVVNKLKEVKGMVNADLLLSLFDEVIDAIKGTVSKISRIAPSSVRIWLQEALTIVLSVRQKADEMIAKALTPVQSLLDDVAKALQDQVDQGHRAFPDTPSPNLHQLDDSVVDINPRILTTTQKGLYGEIISDHYMVSNGFTNMLPEARQVRSLEDVPRGRGIDGIYLKTDPPPLYVITETKFRLDSGKYIDSDGIARSSVLPTTRGSEGYPAAKQMSDAWIHPRIPDEIGDDGAYDVMTNGYERWLMLVDESGEVVNISKLNHLGNSTESIDL